MVQATSFKKVAASILLLLGVAVAVWAVLTFSDGETAQPAASIATTDQAAGELSTTFSGNSTDSGSGETKEPQTALSGAASYPITESLSELVQKAEVIAIGKVVDVGGVHNQARHPSDPSQPAIDVYSVGREYHVAVERYLRGKGSQEIMVSQFEGIFNMQREGMGNPTTWKPGTFTFRDTTYVLSDINTMSPGQTYLFFLRRPPSNPDLLVASSEPYRFRRDNAQGVPEGTFNRTWPLAAMDWEDLLAQVEAEASSS